MQFTAPVDVPVVAPANRPQSAAPMRTSLPSMLPPPWVVEIDWSTPIAVSRGLPFCSANIVNPAKTMRMPAITARSSRDWRLSLTILPNITTTANGISSREKTSRKLLIAVGFSNG